MSGSRLPDGGRIDRSRPLGFRFEGRSYLGYEGDTLASALLANGVDVLGRSFKLHRPRGLFAAGVEEPNALVQLETGARTVPNVRATEIELYEGLSARAVNCWPSARHDLGGALGLLSRFLPAGFYYKTFMWPSWSLFEPFIRRAAGLGHAPQDPDPDSYDARFAHCDVLVVGSGPAGLSAALAATEAQARVMVCEQDPDFGGSLLWDQARVDDLDGPAWALATVQRLASAKETRLLRRTTAVGYLDHNTVILAERAKDSRGDLRPGQPRIRLWQVRAKQVVLACGALERPLVFPGNDRPGVMLASAVRQYVAQWAVRPGRRAVLFVNNDEAYATAHVLKRAGVEVAAIVDARPQSIAASAAQAGGLNVLAGAVVVGTRGSPSLSQVQIRQGDGHVKALAADLLAVSGGRNPTVQLHRQAGGQLAWDEDLAAFRPTDARQALRSAGAAAGDLGLAAALRAGHAAGAAASADLGLLSTSIAPRPVEATSATPLLPLWRVEAKGKAFVDLQNDVTVDDIALASREGFRSVEHLKRYTTLGMAPDQGKTSNVNGLAVLAELTGRTVSQTGSTLYRFPYTPLPVGALAAWNRGDLYRPIRRLPAEAMHRELGAVFEDYGEWRRPAYYPKAGETAHAAEQREARAVRESVGFLDNSPLGKIEVLGPDAGAFLDRVYANTVSTLKPGRARYGLMLNELGVVIDDGVTLRLADDHFWVGTTSSGAARIAAWMEQLLQCDWPELRVLMAPVTTAWAVPTLSGPGARGLLQALGTDIDLSPEAFPHMSVRDGTVAGVRARVCRVSYTGEVGYEINIPVAAAEVIWPLILEVGRAHGLVPVGLDALMLLRTEKGYIHLGADTDGLTSPDDIGWGHVLRRKTDFIGRRSLTRPENLRADRHQLVGLQALVTPPGGFLPVGAHLRTPNGTDSEGYVTSSGFSPTLGRDVALGMIKAGRSRTGEVLQVLTDNGSLQARVVAPCAFDPDGSRLDG